MLFIELKTKNKKKTPAEPKFMEQAENAIEIKEREEKKKRITKEK